MTRTEFKKIKKYIENSSWRDNEEPMDVLSADNLLEYLSSLIKE